MSTIASSLEEIKTTLSQILASAQTFSLDSLDQLRRKDPDRADGLLATHIGGNCEDRQKKIFNMAESLRVNREKCEKEKKEAEKKETERKEAQTKERKWQERVRNDRKYDSPEALDVENPFSDLDWYGRFMEDFHWRRKVTPYPALL